MPPSHAFQRPPWCPRYRLGKAKAPALGERDGNKDPEPPARAAPAQQRGGPSGGGGAAPKPKWQGVANDDDDDDALVENHRLPDPRARYDAPEPQRRILGQPGSDNARGAADGGLDATLQQFVQALYVGDRVRGTRTGRQAGTREGRSAAAVTLLWSGCGQLTPVLD